jgi:hypothetical protein
MATDDVLRLNKFTRRRGLRAARSVWTRRSIVVVLSSAVRIAGPQGICRVTFVAPTRPRLQIALNIDGVCHWPVMGEPADLRGSLVDARMKLLA